MNGLTGAPTPLLKRNQFVYFLLGVVIITTAAIIFYWPILSLKGPNTIPWGSDSLGHISKAEFLKESIQQGIYNPKIFPGWYMGSQVFRYYPLLPYYALLFFGSLFGNLVLSSFIYIFCFLLIGGLTFLLFKRWVGWLPAIACGVLYMMIPDNILIAFSEGNYPRILTFALVPFLFYLVLRALDRSRIALVGISFLFGVFVLCHAMMAAIYAVFVVLLAVVLWVAKQTQLKTVLWVILMVILGLGISAWWLLPSQSGGITEFSAGALAEAYPAIPLTTIFNPFLRISNPEQFYVSLGVVLFCLAAVFIKKIRTPYVISFTIVGLLGVLVATPGFKQAFEALPGTKLLLTMRFLGTASTLLLMAVMWAISRFGKKFWWASLLVVLLIGIDSSISRKLVHANTPTPELVTSTESMSDTPGWREATLDQSRLGAVGSYFVDETRAREQVFGWSFGAARNAFTVASLNDSLLFQAYAYLSDRLDLYGVDDIILLNSVVSDPQLLIILQQQGFSPVLKGNVLTYFHRDGVPRGVIADWQGMAIGKGAINYSYLFPEIMIADSIYVDDYSLTDLTRYPTLILSGFKWHDKVRAESLIQQVASAGINVVVDLTQTQADPVAQIPNFLGVWGESIILDPSPVVATWKNQLYVLSAFGKPDRLWYTHTPQGLDEETVTIDYLGKSATAIGSVTRDGNKIWFVGLNLMYHTLGTNDQNALKMLSEILNIQAGKRNVYQTIPLQMYKSNANGYSFGYFLDSDSKLVVPITVFDGTTVSLDNAPISFNSMGQMVQFDAPAGIHLIQIGFQETSVYLIGKIVSIVSGVFLIVLIVYFGITARRKKGV